MKISKDKQAARDSSHIDYFLYIIAGSAVLSVGFSLLLWLQG